MSDRSSARLLRQKLDAATTARLARVLDLETLLSRQWVEAQEAWPSVSLPLESYMDLLGEVLSQASDPADTLTSLVPADLYIAAACLDEVDEAHRGFEERYLTPLRGQLFKMGLGEQQIQDINQSTRIKLFVAEGDTRARIRDYVGRGRLGGLVQVMVTRSALDLVRRDKRGTSDEDALLSVPVTGSDPELAALRKQCTTEFRDAFMSALSRLDGRERTLLRLRYIDQLGVDKIAALYDVHRTSASRWYTALRQRLLEETKKSLQERLLISDDRLSSILGFVESQVDFSIERLLQTQPDLGEGD